MLCSNTHLVRVIWLTASLAKRAFIPQILLNLAIVTVHGYPYITFLQLQHMLGMFLLEVS